MSKYKEYIAALRHTVTIAALNYEVWWVYKGKDTRPKYIDVMNRYSIFFQTSIHAHFVALVIALYKLYEQRTDTYNIPQLLAILKKDKSLDAATLRSLQTQYEAVKPLWKKVQLLRNNVFGHTSKARTTEQAFRQAGITPVQLETALKKTEALLNDITRALDQSTHAFNLGAQEDLERMLATLANCKGAK